MLPNGRAENSAEVEKSAAMFVKSQLAQAEIRQGNAPATGTDQRTAGAGSAITNIPSAPFEFKAELVGEGVSIIMQSAKEGANLTRRMFNLIRACGTIPIAKGTLTVAEEKAIEKASAGSVADGERPITSLAGLAEANGMNSLGYIQIKSNLFKAHEKFKEHRDVVQRLYNYKERIEKAPKSEIQAGWLDIFAERYNDPKKGSALYMRDRTFSLTAVKEVDRYAKQLQREAAARQEGAAQQNAAAGASGAATDAVTQMRSGDRQRAAISEALQNVIGLVTRTVHNAANVLEEAFIVDTLTSAVNTLTTSMEAVAADFKARVAAAGNSPQVDRLEGAENEPTLEEQTSAAQGAESVETAQDESKDGEEELPELTDEDEKNIKSLGDDMEQTGTGV